MGNSGCPFGFHQTANRLRSSGGRQDCLGHRDPRSDDHRFAYDAVDQAVATNQPVPLTQSFEDHQGPHVWHPGDLRFEFSNKSRSQDPSLQYEHVQLLSIERSSPLPGVDSAFCTSFIAVPPNIDYSFTAPNYSNATYDIQSNGSTTVPIHHSSARFEALDLFAQRNTSSIIQEDPRVYDGQCNKLTLPFLTGAATAPDTIFNTAALYSGSSSRNITRNQDDGSDIGRFSDSSPAPHLAPPSPLSSFTSSPLIRKASTDFFDFDSVPFTDETIDGSIFQYSNAHGGAYQHYTPQTTKSRATSHTEVHQYTSEDRITALQQLSPVDNRECLRPHAPAFFDPHHLDEYGQDFQISQASTREPSRSSQQLESPREPMRISSTSEGLWVCEECDVPRAFKQRSQLRKHRYVHTRPFRCDFPGCSQPGFGTKKELKRHITSVHKPETAEHPCPVADCARHTRPFPRADNMKRHLLKVHGLRV